VKLTLLIILRLVSKYSAVDRESAYEMHKKITEVNESVAENTEEEKLKRKNEGQNTANVVGKSVLKVLTGATFPRSIWSFN
jgi:predicted transcriptional regulator